MTPVFPSWHVIEDIDTGLFSAHLFLDERQYATDRSEDEVYAQYDIDECIDLCLSKYNAMVYELDYRYEPRRILHDPQYF